MRNAPRYSRAITRRGGSGSAVAMSTTVGAEECTAAAAIAAEPVATHPSFEIVKDDMVWCTLDPTRAAQPPCHLLRALAHHVTLAPDGPTLNLRLLQVDEYGVRATIYKHTKSGAEVLSVIAPDEVG